MSTHPVRGIPRSRADRHARRLCRQVHEEIELALAGLGDPVLDGVSVFAVELEGLGSALRIGLVVPDDRDPSRVREAIERAKGVLREGVAAAIRRKRTPQLTFAVIRAHVVAGGIESPGEVAPRADRVLDLHGLDEDGMVACNPRDREAAHRAEVEGIATADFDAVTCARCRTVLARRRRETRG
jgi:ribosome-binding factor A